MFIEIPAQEGRQQNAVAETRNREKLRYALQKSQNGGLQEGHASHASTQSSKNSYELHQEGSYWREVGARVEAFYEFVTHSKTRMWQQWVNAILGLWVVAVPFIGITGAAFIWTLAITGIVIAVLGVWGAQESSPEKYGEMRLQH